MKLDDIRRQLKQIDEAIGALGQPAGAAAQANIRSLERLRERLIAELGELSPGMTLRFQDAEHSTEIPMRKLAQALSSLSDAMAYAVNDSRGNDSRSLSEAFRSMVDFHLVAIQPGSVRLWLRAPREMEDLEKQHADSIGHALAASIERLLETLTIAGEQGPSSDHDALTHALEQLGPRPARHLSRFARVIADEGYQVSIKWRSHRHRDRDVELSPLSAEHLRRAIRTSHVDYREITLLGTLVTVSRVRRDFDILLDDGERITGKVRTSLQPYLREFYDRRVHATLLERVRISPATNEEVVRYELIGLDFARNEFEPVALEEARPSSRPTTRELPSSFNDEGELDD